MYDTLHTNPEEYTKFSERKKNSQSRPQVKEIYVFILLSKIAAWSFVRLSSDGLSSEPKMALETLEAQRNSPDLLVRL